LQLLLQLLKLLQSNGANHDRGWCSINVTAITFIKKICPSVVISMFAMLVDYYPTTTSPVQDPVIPTLCNPIKLQRGAYPSYFLRRFQKEIGDEQLN
jgi:hypothetical protein